MRVLRHGPEKKAARRECQRWAWFKLVLIAHEQRMLALTSSHPHPPMPKKEVTHIRACASTSPLPSDGAHRVRLLRDAGCSMRSLERPAGWWSLSRGGGVAYVQVLDEGTL